MKITKIYSYPLKSGKAVGLHSTAVLPTGFIDDRALVVINERDRVITGREFPGLTAITARISDGTVAFSKAGVDEKKFTLPLDEKRKVSFNLFRKEVEGLLFDTSVSEWFGTYIGITCRLAYLKDNYMPISPKQGGKEGDYVGYADASPIHLISEASLDALNLILDKRITPLHFRPNLVVSASKPYAEDKWKTVHINDCEFEVHNHCKRCVFTTIDPNTAEKDENFEPLRTLAKFRKDRNEACTFGIYLVPRKTGSIQVGNKIVIEV